jgi:hypothetical protein
LLRYTFVLHVHPEGISTLENLTTHELIQVSDLVTVGSQIDSWVQELRAASEVDDRVTEPT